MVGTYDKTVSSGLWLLCNQTCGELPVSSDDVGKLHLCHGGELQDLVAQ